MKSISTINIRVSDNGGYLMEVYGEHHHSEVYTTTEGLITHITELLTKEAPSE